MIEISTDQQEKYGPRNWARLINSLSGPKSANLIGTVSKEGDFNLSIVSSVFHLGANPPLLGFIVRPHSDKSPRHTLENIIETRNFTVNQVSQSFFEKAHQTSARYARGESEFIECGLVSKQKGSDKAPFVQEAKIQMGVRLSQVIDIQQNGTHMVIGEIQQIFLQDGLLREDGSVDISAAHSVAVTGLDEYHVLSKLGRLSYAKKGRPVKRLDAGESTSQ